MERCKRIEKYAYVFLHILREILYPYQVNMYVCLLTINHTACYLPVQVFVLYEFC